MEEGGKKEEGGGISGKDRGGEGRGGGVGGKRGERRTSWMCGTCSKTSAAKGQSALALPSRQDSQDHFRFEKNNKS